MDRIEMADDAKARAKVKEDLLRKHKAERKALRGECNALLSGKKGEERQKAESEGKTRTEALEEKHTGELEMFELGEEIEGLSVNAPASTPAAAPRLQANGKPMSKAQLKHEKKKLMEKKTADAAAARKAQAGPTLRELEIEAVEKKLGSDGLQMKTIAADGHCMYRAVADQLMRKAGPGGANTLGGAAGEDGYLFLRAMTARHMREHRSQFELFVAAEDENDISFDAYVDRIKNSAYWGGQLELMALANAYKTPIKVISADSEPIIMGEDFEGDPLVVTFHKHFLALGEHYNSAKPKYAGMGSAVQC